MKKIITAAFVCLLAAASTARAEEAQRYVRDWISIPLYEAPSSESRAVHPGLPSGTVLTLIEDAERNGYQHVRTSAGAEGWMASRYLIDEPTAKMQLDGVTAELSELRKTNGVLKSQLDNVPGDTRVAAQQMTQLKADNERLQGELQILQEAPSNATQLALENVELKRANETLQEQIATRSGEVEELRRDNNYSLFRQGAIAVLAGALLTLLIINLRPKKKSEWF